MKPDWDKLAKDFEGSSKVVVADVDCTGAGERLCERFGIEGFPTLKSFSPPDTDGEDYEGGREYAALKEFAGGLGPGCSPTTKENCDPKQLAELEALLKIPTETLQAEYDELKTALEDAGTAHDDLMKSLQEQYEESEKALNTLKKSKQPRMKALRGVLPPQPPPPPRARPGMDDDEGMEGMPEGDEMPEGHDEM